MTTLKYCPDLLNRSKGTFPILFAQITLQKYHKMSKILKSTSSPGNRNSNLKPVTGSKQKHMAIPSIVGSAISLQYPLFQGLLTKEQLK